MIKKQREPGEVTSTQEYAALLNEIKSVIHSSRTQAALSVNRELITMYYQIGLGILERQKKEGWGTNVVDLISADLQKEFPGMKGFSSRNLQNMRTFAKEYKNLPDLQQLVAEIPWGHNIAIMQKVKTAEERGFYIKKAIESGWSRNVLIHQIESGFFHRLGKGINNVDAVLPSGQSELVRGIFKDPLVLDFIEVSEFARESELQKSLIGHLKQFMLELGKGFAFIGEQYPLNVGGQDYYLDLLFYHTKIHCYVVIELKIGDFKPEYVGKLNFYLSALDSLERDEASDNPTIGILLCKERNDVIAEYALRDVNKPMNVATYQLTLPEKYSDLLPSEEELSSEVRRAVVELSGTASASSSDYGDLRVGGNNTDEKDD
jgi:Uncharacterized conserved protein